MNEPKRIAQIVGKWVGGGVEAVIMNYYRNIDKSKIQFDFLCDEDSTNIPYEEIEITGTGYNIDGEVLYNEKNKDKVKNIIDLCAINNEATFKKNKNGYKYFGDSIDIAFLVLKEKLKTNSDLEIIKMIPYESEKQYSAVFYKLNGELRCTVKGSLEKVMNFSKKSKKYIEQNEKLSNEGYRVIAVCDGKVNKTDENEISKLDFLGMVAFIDPVRIEVSSSIEECKRAGIKVLMITGDHPLTAFKIAKDLNLVKDNSDYLKSQGLYKDVLYGIEQTLPMFNKSNKDVEK